MILRSYDLNQSDEILKFSLDTPDTVFSSFNGFLNSLTIHDLIGQYKLAQPEKNPNKNHKRFESHIQSSCDDYLINPTFIIILVLGISYETLAARYLNNF